MSLETFLINPVKGRRRRKKVSGKRRRRGGLPGSLLSRMIRTYGTKRGMKEAWKAYRSGKRNPDLPPVFHRRAVKAHRPTVYSGIRKGRWVRSPFSRSPRINPLGEEVMIVGNPKRRRRRRVRRNDPSPKRRRRSVRKYYLRNAPAGRYRRRGRRYRRNPARPTALAISYRRPMSLIVPAIAGTGGFFAADYIPVAIGMSGSPLTRIGIKAGVAFGGGMVASKFFGSKAGAAFAIGAGINALNDVLRTYVFGTSTITGLGAFAPRTRLRGASGMGVMSPYQMSQRFPS